jgi:hypothetical protein
VGQADTSACQALTACGETSAERASSACTRISCTTTNQACTSAALAPASNAPGTGLDVSNTLRSARASTTAAP